MKNTMQFRKIGGSNQLLLAKAENLEQILQLDEAHWAVNAMPLEAVITDPEFLTFLDTDGNGRIRPAELKNAISWLISILRDYRGIDEGSEILHLDAINPDHPEGAVLRGAAELALRNLGAEDRATLSLTQIRDTKTIISVGSNNGDGIITPEDARDPAIADCIRAVMTCCGTKPDLCGNPGIDLETLERFVQEGNIYLQWLKTGMEEPDLAPYGSRTLEFYTLYASLHDKLNEYFFFCDCMTEEEVRFGSTEKIDPLNTNAMQTFIDHAPLSRPSASSTLSLTGWINPKRKDSLKEFFRLCTELGTISAPDVLTEAEWNEMQKRFEPRTKWVAGKPAGKFDTLSFEQLTTCLSERETGELKRMMENDRSAEREISACSQLRKLILYQKYMLDFVNNFVSLGRLFDPTRLSLIQPGALTMDGRRFTLASLVKDLAEHKKIVQRSDICVMYLELTTGKAPNERKMVLAIAITSGTMRNIFVGKRGVYQTSDGTEWDAKIIDLVQQPVSFTEALLTPFYKFGEFIGKQADRFFSVKAQNVETGISKTVVQAANTPPPAVTAPAAPQKQQTPAVSGSMMLMGGGVGLAALGSSFAFIANSLKSVSFWNVIAVFVGIVFIISAPVMLVSIVKLQHRCISDFFAASGWAINPKMRLSRKMGRLFTYRPKLPYSIFLKGDMIELFSQDFARKTRYKLLFILYLILLICALVSGYILFRVCL